MKIGNIDLFKILIIIFLGIFLYLYYQNSTIGRFQNQGVIRCVLDTKTGEIYIKLPNDSMKSFSPPILK